MNREASVIHNRFAPLFTRHRNTRYWLTIVNDRYDHQYNFFFNAQPRDQRHKSIPLHTLSTYNLETLECVCNDIHGQTPLSFEFVGFTGMIWPLTGRVIQAHKEREE